ncbi:PREDICTED: tetratricopeptide repeat protein 38-like [Tarenaya hassleriana]|uniref:tetratricopeptide repeat protein 38-like n=1 Tax=Tarenaya hassleriana TaxID=28532 RepID=UPI00053C6EAE|nr:PREDICTED: tetratricopeptide repeat protein 38-like [Tarenaya hassleriana]
MILVEDCDTETMSFSDESYDSSSPVSTRQDGSDHTGSPGSDGSPKWSLEPREDTRTWRHVPGTEEGNELRLHGIGKGSRRICWGYDVNTSSDRCIAAIDSYYHQVLSYGREKKVILEAPLHDQDCVLGNILAAHFVTSSDPARANAYARAAASCLEQATPYEKAVFEAVNYLISENRDDHVALELHSQVLKRFPKDLVSYKRVECLCFDLGRPDLSLALIQQVLPENQEADYIYGMLAFPLLELGRTAEAELAARKGYAINKEDPWTHHSLCHVLQYECRFDEAVEFMEECSASWASCSSLRYSHNWWHVAVCYLEGGSPASKVHQIYDHIWKELEKHDAVAPDVYLEALGLLLRLDTRDQLDGFEDRVKIVADYMTDQANWYDGWHLDILTIWALTKVGNASKARELLEGLKLLTSKMNKKKQQLMEKAIRLGNAVYEYASGNYIQALELLGPDFDAVHYKVIGASGLQMEVFNEISYKMLLLTGQSSIAIQVLEKRIKERKGAPFLWRLLEKSYAMEGRGEAASAAGERAKSLEASYFKFA